MQVGTILLTKSNKYIDADGNLPKRPKHDKELLASIIGKENIVSPEAYKMLPQSMQMLCIADTQNRFVKRFKTPITIGELNEADLLIVSRSQGDFAEGKEFRFDNFKCLVKDRKVEIWISIR